MPPLAPTAPDIEHLPNKTAPPTSSNSFPDLYSPESEDDSVFDEMVGNDIINPIKSIGIYIRYPLVVVNNPPHNVAKKRCKTIRKRQVASIRRTQSENMASAWLFSTTLHYVSQEIIRAHTDKIALYNRY